MILLRACCVKSGRFDSIIPFLHVLLKINNVFIEFEQVLPPTLPVYRVSQNIQIFYYDLLKMGFFFFKFQAHRVDLVTFAGYPLPSYFFQLRFKITRSTVDNTFSFKLLERYSVSD